jgi:hypothetical protein
MVYLELKLKLTEAQLAQVLPPLVDALEGLPAAQQGLRLELTGGMESLDGPGMILLDHLQTRLGGHCRLVAMGAWQQTAPWPVEPR